MPSETEYLMRKLSAVVDLSDAQRDTLNALFDRPRQVPAGTVLVHEGEPNYTGFLIASGWATRERLLRNGDRQVVNFMVPGDLSEPGAFVTESADHTIATVTEAVVLPFAHDRWFATLYADGMLTAALWWLAGHEEAVLKEHIVAIGRRKPEARLLYMAWELCRRLELVGLCNDGRFLLPVSQQTLADALGLSPRHLSRVLADLHAKDVVQFADGHVTIKDPARLLDLCDCRDVYLQITSIAGAVRKALQARQPHPPAPV